MSQLDSVVFLEHYGVLVLAVAEQLGVPLPAVPALLAVGALAADGRVSIVQVLGTISVAALATDFAWYELGRRRGARVLVSLCRLSLEPDWCAHRAQSIFARYGARSMLVSKFVPGLTTLMPPLAGVFGVTRVCFALYAIASVLLWAGTWLAVGYFFSSAIVSITARATALGRALGFVRVLVFAGYIVLRYVRRRLFLRKLRVAHVSPEALKRQLDDGEDVVLIDLRTPLEVVASPYAIPGSFRLAAGTVGEHEAEILRSGEVVLYGASANDVPSARVALQLSQRGIGRVRSLEGGLAAWLALGLPVRPIQPSDLVPDRRSDQSQSAAA